jgi:L-ascorbate metabolism protein UlaG (beta-lactamase superfamily)
MLVEEGGVRILFDPGSFSTTQNELTGLEALLITHEHGDHLTMDSVKAIVANNPDVQIFTNKSVHALLEKEGIASTVLMHGEKAGIKGISIEAVGKDHAILISGVPPIENVGFMVAERLFYPGDALTIPATQVEILALPAAAPWSKISEIIEYAIAIKPKVAFPVHDSILAMPQMMSGFFTPTLASHGIEFRPIEIEVPLEF